MKNLSVQKRLAADVAKVSQKRIAFDVEKLETIKEAITKRDVRALIKDGVITVKQKEGNTRGRIRKSNVQKSKGRLKGKGSKKGTHHSRLSKKEAWMIKIRALRTFIKEVKDKNLVSVSTARDLYRKSKGGFFRSKRHIKLYLTEHNLFEGKK